MDYEPIEPTRWIASLLTEAISVARSEKLQDVALALAFAMERVKAFQLADR